MRSEWQEYTGFGELLCFVLAWVVGIAAVWSDYADKNQDGRSGSVAVSGKDRGAGERLD